MFIRRITTIVACIATVAFASGAEAQDTTRTRDTMRTQSQMQRQGATMTTQARDSMISRLQDSANRATDPTIAQRLRDSVTTLRAMAVSPDTMRNRMTTQQQQQQSVQQQQSMQQQSAQQQQQQQQQQSNMMTSDQRVRMQKDGRPYPDSGTPSNPGDPSGG
jgi:hypothetical protein